MLLLTMLVACAPGEDGPKPPLDTALPSPVTSAGTTTTGTGGVDTDWYENGYAYTGPMEIFFVHQSCESGEWAYIAEARGAGNLLVVQQWILGVAPEDRPSEPGSYVGNYVGRYSRHGASSSHWDVTYGRTRWTYDWTGIGVVLDPRPNCAVDVGSERIVVALHFEGSIPYNEGEERCVMFGPDAENLRADPDHYRAYETRNYHASSAYDYSACQIIPWPSEPTRP